jgi:rapamycin-insensitive companion of mTOR
MTPPVRSLNPQVDAPSTDQGSLLAPTRTRDGRSMSAAAVSVMAGSRGGQSSYATAHSGPGSFSTQLKPTTSQDSRLRPDIDMHAITVGDNENTTSEQRQADLQDQIDKETKIKIGSENLLEALNAKSAKNVKDQRAQVEEQLNISNKKLAQLKAGLAIEIHKADCHSCFAGTSHARHHAT